MSQGRPRKPNRKPKPVPRKAKRKPTKPKRKLASNSKLTPQLANDMIGYKYDLANFLSFGGVHLAAARICSEFISDLAYNASMLRGSDYPLCLTPDISGNQDAQKTPNDLINSGEMFRVPFQGLLGATA